jgi:uncharacterized protein YggU (UPF0235/DUF167 family)
MTGSIVARVVPRSSRTAVERTPGGLVVRVRAAPEAGRATSEAGAALAQALGVPKTTVILRTGARSRTKIFEVRGLSPDELERRLDGL